MLHSTPLHPLPHHLRFSCSFLSSLLLPPSSAPFQSRSISLVDCAANRAERITSGTSSF